MSIFGVSRSSDKMKSKSNMVYSPRKIQKEDLGIHSIDGGIGSKYRIQHGSVAHKNVHTTAVLWCTRKR